MKKVDADIKDLELELWLRRRNSGLIVWTTKDGKEISLKDMSDTHLENAINKLVRDSEAEDRYLEGLAGLADKDWFF